MTGIERYPTFFRAKEEAVRGGSVVSCAWGRLGRCGSSHPGCCCGDPSAESQPRLYGCYGLQRWLCEIPDRNYLCRESFFGGYAWGCVCLEGEWTRSELAPWIWSERKEAVRVDLQCIQIDQIALHGPRRHGFPKSSLNATAGHSRSLSWWSLRLWSSKHLLTKLSPFLLLLVGEAETEAHSPVIEKRNRVVV